MNDDKFVWRGSNMPKIIGNDSIQCADCIYRTDPDVIECEKYKRKPDAVLNGTGPCKYYTKKVQ